MTDICPLSLTQEITDSHRVLPILQLVAVRVSHPQQQDDLPSSYFHGILLTFTALARFFL